MKNETEPYKSIEFLEKKRILEMEKEVIELRHKYRVQELDTEKENKHADHLERMAEIRLKNANIQRSIEDKDRRVREFHEKRAKRFAQLNGKPAFPEEKES